jgi:glucose-1-phosphate cytidylyltransferase
MKAVILCGGKGTRLREETEYKPKPLVEIGGKPILWHIMKIYAHYGITEFILCLGFKSDMIKEYFIHYREMAYDFKFNLIDNNKEYFYNNDNSIEDWKITFAYTGENESTGARVAKIKKYLGDDEDFFLTYGDGVADVDILEGYKKHKKLGAVVTLLTTRAQSPFGVIEHDSKEEFAISFKEKPFLEGHINGGWMICNKRIFDFLSEDENCVLEEKPLKDILKAGGLATYKNCNFWFSMDTYKHYEELNKMCKENNCPWMIWRK